MMHNIIFSNYRCWLGKWIALYPHFWSGVSEMLILTFSLTLLNNYSCSPLAPLHTIFLFNSSLADSVSGCPEFYLGYIWDNLKRKITFQAMSDFMTAIVHARRLCTYQCNAGGGGRQGMGWGFDCLCCPWGKAFDWSCSPGGRDIWIFLRRTWRYLTADSDEKDWDQTYVSPFHASRMRHTVWKDQEVMKANENKRRLSRFHCFVFKFLLF